MKQYDYLIVGAGLFGAVFAQQATKAGKSCLVIDKRDHIAGNIYTENVEGINVHRYGTWHPLSGNGNGMALRVGFQWYAKECHTSGRKTGRVPLRCVGTPYCQAVFRQDHTLGMERKRAYT